MGWLSVHKTVYSLCTCVVYIIICDLQQYTAVECTRINMYPRDRITRWCGNYMSHVLRSALNPLSYLYWEGVRRRGINISTYILLHAMYASTLYTCLTYVKKTSDIIGHCIIVNFVKRIILYRIIIHSKYGYIYIYNIILYCFLSKLRRSAPVTRRTLFWCIVLLPLLIVLSTLHTF